MADRVTQVAVETLIQGSPKARVTQVAAESLVTGSPKARVTQICLEVIIPSHAPPGEVQPIMFVIT